MKAVLFVLCLLILFVSVPYAGESLTLTSGAVNASMSSITFDSVDLDIVFMMACLIADVRWKELSITVKYSNSQLHIDVIDLGMSEKIIYTGLRLDFYL